VLFKFDLIFFVFSKFRFRFKLTEYYSKVIFIQKNTYFHPSSAAKIKNIFSSSCHHVALFQVLDFLVYFLSMLFKFYFICKTKYHRLLFIFFINK
jgi:hypothetical protein